jgi:hypothetical protein
MRSTVHPILGLIIVAIMFIAIATMAVRALYLDEKFATSTHRSQATIEHDWTTHGSKSGTHYHTRYHFADEQGHVWADSSEIASGTYQRIHVGTIVPVKYLESDPNQSRIDLPEEDKWHWRQDEILACLGLGIGLVFALAIASNWRR